MDTCKMALASAVLVIAAGGCYLGQPGTYTARPGTGGPPQPTSPGAARTLSLGFGASGGLFIPNASVYADGLSEGFMWDIHASLWLNPYLAVQVDVGRSTMADRGDVSGGLGGQMTVSPVTVSAIVSVPMPMSYGMPGYGVGVGGGDFYRWRFGAGLGTMGLSHTEYTDVPDSIDVVCVTAGAEWVIGFGDRLFAVADIYFGSLVEATQPSAWNWDLTSITTMRVGIEIGF